MFVKDKGRFAFAICLTVALVAPVVSKSSDHKEGSNSWIVSATIIRNGQQSGSGIYLKSGLVVTAAHLIAVDANMGVRISNAALPAKVLKQGSVEDVD